MFHPPRVLLIILLAVIFGGAFWFLRQQHLERPQEVREVVISDTNRPTEIHQTVSRPDRPIDVQKVVARPDRPIEVHNKDYIGSKSCQNCHANQYHTWHTSFHRTMTQVATPESVVGNFENVTYDLFGYPFRLERRGDRFWVEMPDLEWEGPAANRPRVEKEIVQVTGSHHMQVYWYPTGESRLLGQLPLIYLIDQQTWVPRDAAFLRPPANSSGIETGRWNNVCIRCHTTGPQPRFQWTAGENPQQQNPKIMDTHVAEFGISCEACHGPAAQHVQWHHDSQRTTAIANSELVVPDRLPAKLSSQVCGQCHSVWFFSTLEDYVDWSQHGFRYRPGDNFEKMDRLTVHASSPHPAVQQQLHDFPADSIIWSDGMVRVSGREYNGLIESPCFTHDDEQRQLSCLSCHEMHSQSTDAVDLANWKEDQLKPGMRTNNACLQCHTEYADQQTLIAHTRHKADSTGSNCYNCHMPYTTYGILKAIRSHRIDRPSVQASLQTGRPNACNQCHLDETLAWTSNYLERWYDIQQPTLSSDEQNIAASILWSLKGDAGQRALMAWSMGWSVARAVSGSEWMGVYLAQLMNDPYDAVRIIADRTLQQHPGHEGFEFNPVGLPAVRQTTLRRLMESELIKARNSSSGTQLLFDTDGKLDMTTFRRLLRQRDQRPVDLKE